MDKELCFYIEGNKLYLEQILVEYMNVPIFFLCKENENGQYYVVLCVDVYELNYIIVKVKMVDVYKLLHGVIPMRDVFLNQDRYWKVFSGDEIEQDEVMEGFTSELDKTILPKENACFEGIEMETVKYIQEFDRSYFADEHFSTIQIKVDLNEISIDGGYENLIEDEKCRNLVKYKVDSQIKKTNMMYDEKMDEVGRSKVVLKKEISERLKTLCTWCEFAA